MLKEKINNIIKRLQECVDSGVVTDTATLDNRLHEEVDNELPEVENFLDINAIIAGAPEELLRELYGWRTAPQIAYIVLYEGVTENPKYRKIKKSVMAGTL